MNFLTIICFQQMLIFVAIDGWKLHKSSDDARRQLEIEKLEARRP